jgi:hypothetical protein
MSTLFGPMAFRKMLREATATRADRQQVAKERQLQRQLDREARIHRATGGAKAAGTFSLLAPFLAVGAAFLIARFAPDRRAASVLFFPCILVIIAGLGAGLWALLSGIRYRTRAGRGMAIAGICIGCLLMLLLILAPSIRRSSRHVPPPRQQSP